MVLRVLQVLGETGLSPTRLEVEISEQALVSDIVAARGALDAFHQAGVRIALDDFGTGNSSLQHLRECHFDRLKIDRSFVTSMSGSDENTALVNAILGLSKALGLPVTAEGVETEALVGMLEVLVGVRKGRASASARPCRNLTPCACLAGWTPATRLIIRSELDGSTGRT